MEVGYFIMKLDFKSKKICCNDWKKNYSIIQIISVLNFTYCDVCAGDGLADVAYFGWVYFNWQVSMDISQFIFSSSSDYICFVCLSTFCIPSTSHPQLQAFFFTLQYHSVFFLLIPTLCIYTQYTKWQKCILVGLSWAVSLSPLSICPFKPKVPQKYFLKSQIKK